MIELRHENDTATLRSDGRKLNESRQVSFELGTIKKTSGSAIFTIGNTKVAAFLQGPHQVSQRESKLIPDSCRSLNVELVRPLVAYKVLRKES